MATRPHSPLRARIRAWPPQRVDAAIGALVAVEASLETAFVDAPAWAHLANTAIAIGLGGAIALRRRAPVVAVAVAWVLAAATNALPEQMTESGVGLFLGLLFVVYSMALFTEGRALWTGVAISLAGVVTVVATSPNRDSFGGDLIFLALIGVVAPVTAGQLLQGRLRLNRALREKTARVEREREQRAAEATAEERARIAGELHDVVAHALGAMTVQAAAARRLAAKDPPRAAGAFEAIEGTGRDALTELRRLLAVLRRQDDGSGLAPQPKLAYVDDLVRRTRAAGLPVDFAIEGAPNGDLPPGVDLTAYRVVQEALAEALRIGGAGHAGVTVRYGEDEIQIEVVDDGVRTAGRHLLGMHERVRVYGGQLQAGPRREGGHEVKARLPVEASA